MKLRASHFLNDDDEVNFFLHPKIDARLEKETFA